MCLRGNPSICRIPIHSLRQAIRSSTCFSGCHQITKGLEIFCLLIRQYSLHFLVVMKAWNFSGKILPRNKRLKYFCMARKFCFYAAWILTSIHSFCQDNKSSLELYGQIMADGGYNFNSIDPVWFDMMRPSKLPS